MLFLAELVGRPLGVIEWFLPGFFATLAILFMYGLFRLEIIPGFLFFGLFAFYLGWIIPPLAFAPAVVHRPLGGYSSLPSCALACFGAVVLSAFLLKDEQTRSKEYTAIIVGFFISVFIINGLPSVT